MDGGNPIPPNYYRVDVFLNDWFTIPQKYQITRFLGRGTQGCVALAIDRQKQMTVAIKKIHLPEDTAERQPFRRAYRELFCMLHISHPNIIKFHEAFTPYQTAEEMREFYIVREYLDGTMTQLPYEELTHGHVQKIIHDICRGIHHLNALGISHRDLKPTNILITKETDVKLCDFGQSNITDPFMQNTTYIIMRYYRAPEVVCHIRGFENRTVDVWSIGCIFAELLTGQILFRGTDHVDQYHRFTQLLGSPSPTFFERMDDNVRHYLEGMPRYPRRNIEYIFPNSMFLQNFRESPELCDSARDLLSRMLVIEPENRLSIERVFEHPYLQEYSADFEATDLVLCDRFRDVYLWDHYSDAKNHREEIFNVIQNQTFVIDNLPDI